MKCIICMDALQLFWQPSSRHLLKLKISINYFRSWHWVLLISNTFSAKNKLLTGWHPSGKLSEFESGQGKWKRKCVVACDMACSVMDTKSYSDFVCLLFTLGNVYTHSHLYFAIVCPSVCLSHACFVTKPNNALRVFWYHTEGQAL